MKTGGQLKMSFDKKENILTDITNTTSVVSDLGKKSKNTRRTDTKKINSKKECRTAKFLRKDKILIDNRKTAKEILSKKKFVDIAVQTDNYSEKDDTISADIAVITDNLSEVEENITANKLTCVLKETLDQNYLLAKENEILKKDNALLEDIVNEAKEMALIIKQLTQESE